MQPKYPSFSSLHSIWSFFVNYCVPLPGLKLNVCPRGLFQKKITPVNLLTGALLVLTGALILIQISFGLVPMKLLNSLVFYHYHLFKSAFSLLEIYLLHSCILLSPWSVADPGGGGAGGRPAPPPPGKKEGGKKKGNFLFSFFFWKKKCSFPTCITEKQ